MGCGIRVYVYRLRGLTPDNRRSFIDDLSYGEAMDALGRWEAEGYLAGQVFHINGDLVTEFEKGET